MPLQLSVLYLKPAQTGFPADSDARLVAAAAHLPLAAGPHAAHLLGSSSSSSSESSSSENSSSGSSGGGSHLAKVLYAWSRPVSPHLAVELEGRPVSDRQLAAAVAAELRGFAAAGLQASGGGAGNGSIAIVETAGGVASPGPSGTLQVGLVPTSLQAAACLAPSGGCWCRVSRLARQLLLLLSSWLVKELLQMYPKDSEQSPCNPCLSRSATCCARCAFLASWLATAGWGASLPPCRRTTAWS